MQGDIDAEVRAIDIDDLISRASQADRDPIADRRGRELGREAAKKKAV